MILSHNPGSETLFINYQIALEGASTAVALFEKQNDVWIPIDVLRPKSLSE